MPSRPGPAPALPLDAHLHTDISHDADVPIDVYAALAREASVAEIAITDHLDFHARDPNFALADFGRRERMVREAAERWDGRPLVRFGVEITYESGLEDQIRAYLAGHDYDYTIGSIHISDRRPLHRRSAAQWCAGKTHREASAWYWDEVEAAIRSGLFDALGHLDVVKRWMVEHLGPFEYERHADIYDRMLRTLLDTGTALEVNSSGLRQPAREMYPPPVVVERFRELGGQRVVAGSDAHRSHHFGFALGEAYRAIENAGFDRLFFRRGNGGPVVVEFGEALAGATAGGEAGT
ncbi:MAG: histidinol-phosphatase HisJ family protein [Chloroflexi bacterium]|nr:histidinol-phosphatase HisJ family protein [Chloroflexota bacterium]